mgnify:FL=1
MAFSDGKKNIFEIALKVNKSLSQVIDACKLLKEKKLVKTKFI